MGYIVTFTKVLMIYHNWIHLFHHCPLSPLHSWNSLNMSHFCTWVHGVFIRFSLSHPFLIPSHSHWYQSQTGTILLSCSPFLKKMHFCLFKIALQGVSLWHFHVHMFYNSNRFMLSIFLLSTLFTFLQWFQQA
jgi:hypothetical protein